MFKFLICQQWKDLPFTIVVLMASMTGVLVVAQENEGQETGVERVQTEIVKQDVDQDEGDDDVAAVMPANPFGFEPAQMLKAKRFYLMQTFQVEIEVIERVCEPTEQQKAKLRVAAKGAAKKLSQRWVKDFNRDFGPRVAGGGQGDSDDSDSEIELDDANAEEITDANQIDDNLAQFIMMGRAENPFKTKSPENDEAWTNLVAGVLTPEQNRAWAEHKESQRKQQNEELLRSTFTLLSRELRLTEEQTEKLRGALQPHFADVKLECVPFFETYMSYYFAAKVKDDELATFMTPAQIQKLRMILWPARQIGMMMEMDDE